MVITELKTTRLRRGIKQKNVAVKSGKALRTYQEYEAGERVPDVHTAQRIAKALETTVEELFPLEDTIN